MLQYWQYKNKGVCVLRKLTSKNLKTSNLATKSYSTNPLSEKELLPLVFSKRVIDLYEKQADIKKFAKLVLEENITEDFLKQAELTLLEKDVFNPFDNKSYEKLAQNRDLLKDLTTKTYKS